MSIEERQSLIPIAGAKPPCVAISTSNITLSGEQTIDGRACVAGNRVLVGGQTDASENGIYLVSTGAWTRSTDFNQNAEVSSGVMIGVFNTAGSSGVFQVQFSGDMVLGTTEMTITPIEGSIINDGTMASNSTVAAPSVASVITYVAAQIVATLLDEDNFASDSATQAPSQQSTAAYIATQLATVLPSQSGNANRFLGTDGTSAAWETLSGQFNYVRLKLNADESIAAGAVEQLTNITEVSDPANIASAGTITVPFDSMMIFLPTAMTSDSNSGFLSVVDIDGTLNCDLSSLETSNPAAGQPPVAGCAAIPVNQGEEVEWWIHNIDSDSAVNISGDATVTESFCDFIFIRGAA